MSSFAYSQDKEITLTTYYPAPYGTYDTLIAEKLAVGKGVSAPSADGVVNLNPLTSVSGGTAPSSGNPGDLYFDATDNAFKYWDKDSGASGEFVDFTSSFESAIGFSVHRNGSDQTITKETHTKLLFAQAEGSLNDGFNLYVTNPASESRFIAPEKGYYVFSGSVYVSDIPAGEDFGLHLFKNEPRATIDDSLSDATDRLVCAVEKSAAGIGDGCTITTPPLYMNGTGDYVSLYVWLDDSSSRTVKGDYSTWFSGYKIGD